MKIGLLFGGPFFEQGVSIVSAIDLLGELDKNQFDYVPILIDTQGRWSRFSIESFFAFSENYKPFSSVEQGPFARDFSCSDYADIDLFFPLLYGAFGEDGKVQGFFASLGLPLLGASLLPSAVTNNKWVAKQLLKAAGIPVVDCFCVQKGDVVDIPQIMESLGSRVVVKPCNLGSSVGVSLCLSQSEIKEALDEIFLLDDRALIEKAIDPKREIECVLLGKNNPLVIGVAELVSKEYIYSYNLKYKDPDGALLLLTAPLSKQERALIESLAIKAYQACCVDAFARIDFFYDGHTFFLNEIQTMPGMRKTSLFPSVLKQAGISMDHFFALLVQQKSGLLQNHH